MITDYIVGICGIVIFFIMAYYMHKDLSDLVKEVEKRREDG